MGELMDATAGQVMTRNPKTVSPDMLAASAVKLMGDPPPQVTVLFVVEAGVPVGILHIHDLLRAGVA
jgi:arabinose-5-phosphate isomerase